MKQRAALYCRLSKEDIDKDNPNDFSESIKNQEAMLVRFALEHDMKVVRIYRDDSFSGLYDDNRPGFTKLLQDAERGYFDVVIAKSQSRLTRNMEHLEKYLHHDFPLWGIRFIGLVDNADTEVKGNKKARQINGLINEWYCEDLSESVKASFHIKQLQGEYLAPAAVYGYLKDPNNKHKLIPDPYASKIVQRIFDLYLKGYGKAKIGKILTKEGVLRPSVYKREVLGLNYHNPHEKVKSEWTFQTISDILSNEVYLGHTIQNKCSKVSYKSKYKKNLPKSEWIIVRNTHEPIISQEVFDAAQQIKKAKTRIVDATPNVTLFWKKLYCADCERTMTRVYSRNKYGPRRTSYICKTYKAHGNLICSSHKIKEEVLSEIVLNAIKKEGKRLLNEEELQKLHYLKVADSRCDTEKQIEEISKKIEKTVGYKEKIYEDYADGILSRDEYKAFKNKYERREQELNDTLSELNLKLADIESDKKKEVKEWIDQFKNYIDISELNREVVEKLIDRIYITDSCEVIVHFKFH